MIFIVKVYSFVVLFYQFSSEDLFFVLQKKKNEIMNGSRSSKQHTMASSGLQSKASISIASAHTATKSAEGRKSLVISLTCIVCV